MNLTPSKTGVKTPKKKAARDFGAIVTAWEDAVLAGTFPAGALFKAAVERQRRELAQPPEGYRFDSDLGDRACRFIELLPLVGEGAQRGQPFLLQGWQVFLVRTFFGWVDAATGAPRFLTLSVWLPKGNGKSPLAAAIGLYILATGRGGERVYSAATTRAQARCVFDSAQDMVRLRPELAKRRGIEAEEHRIRGVNDSRVFAPVSAEANSVEGIRPSVVILDEVHAHSTPDLYRNLQSACSKVEGARFINISTAGFDQSAASIGWVLYCRTRDILLGKVDDPSTFAVIVEADRTLDPFDPATWKQANPNLGVSVSLAGLKSAAQRAQELPSERSNFQTKHLGWWSQSASAFLDLDKWNSLADESITLDTLRPDQNWGVFVGVDLARTRDLTAAVAVASRVREDGKREYRVSSRLAYLPEDSITLSQTPALRLWAEDGWLTLLPGETMTFGPLKVAVEAIALASPGTEVCIDEWSAAELMADLQAAGVTVVAVRQGARSQSEPMKELESAILDGRIRHDGSPVMAMCIDNLIARVDRNGNVAPDREAEHRKIDLAVALINALVRASISAGCAMPYTPDRGIEFIDLSED